MWRDGPPIHRDKDCTHSLCHLLFLLLLLRVCSILPAWCRLRGNLHRHFLFLTFVDRDNKTNDTHTQTQKREIERDKRQWRRRRRRMRAFLCLFYCLVSYFLLFALTLTLLRFALSRRFVAVAHVCPRLSLFVPFFYLAVRAITKM